jgi:hypothetical protein
MKTEFEPLLHATNRAIDAMKITQRLFDLSDGHVLMQACNSLIDEVWRLEKLIELEKSETKADTFTDYQLRGGL